MSIDSAKPTKERKELTIKQGLAPTITTIVIGLSEFYLKEGPLRTAIATLSPVFGVGVAFLLKKAIIWAGTELIYFRFQSRLEKREKKIVRDLAKPGIKPSHKKQLEQQLIDCREKLHQHITRNVTINYLPDDQD